MNQLQQPWQHQDRLAASDAEHLAQEPLAQLVETYGEMACTLAPDALPPALLALACRLLRADAAAVRRFDALDGAWRLLAATGLTPAFLQHAEPVSQTWTGSATDAPAAIEDVARCDLPADRRQILESEGIRALLAVPLSMPGDRSGTMEFYGHTARSFSASDLRLAQALGRVGASAIAMADLYTADSPDHGAASPGHAHPHTGRGA